MRVIAGTARRLQLKTLDGMDTRPTTDRIKETLFNMISAELYDSNFLDLFSGSGGIGIEAQLREKLTRNEYPADIVETAISYVKSFGYINDYEYARSFIESRKERKSRREIYMQLAGKGVSRELIDEAFEESYEREDSTEAIRRLLEKKHYDRENTTPEEKKKIMAYLVRKGFGYDDIRRTMQIYECEMYS